MVFEISRNLDTTSVQARRDADTETQPWHWLAIFLASSMLGKGMFVHSNNHTYLAGINSYGEKEWMTFNGDRPLFCKISFLIVSPISHYMS